MRPSTVIRRTTTHRAIVNHDPFARQSLVRYTYPSHKACDNCGQSPRTHGIFRYAMSPDDSSREYDISGAFCSIGCMRQYHNG